MQSGNVPVSTTQLIDGKVAAILILPGKTGAVITLDGIPHTIRGPMTFRAAPGRVYAACSLQNLSAVDLCLYFYSRTAVDPLPELHGSVGQRLNFAPHFTQEAPYINDTFTNYLATVDKSPGALLTVVEGFEYDYYVQNLGTNDAYLGNGMRTAAEILSMGIKLPARGGNYWNKVYGHSGMTAGQCDLYVITSALQVSPDCVRFHYHSRAF